MNNHPCLVVVQSRFDSRRLPGKALLPFGGTTMLGFLLERLQAGLIPQQFRIIVATTCLKSDDKLAAEACEHGVTVVRGPVDDVMARYVACIKRYPTQLVVRVTADNPFTCPESILRLVERMERKGADYGHCVNYPLGATADGFTAEVIHTLDGLDLTTAQREHLNKHILDYPERYDSIQVEAPKDLKRPDLSLTVDTEDEFRFVQGAISQARKKPWEMGLHEVITALGG